MLASQIRAKPIINIVIIACMSLRRKLLRIGKLRKVGCSM